MCCVPHHCFGWESYACKSILAFFSSAMVRVLFYEYVTELISSFIVCKLFYTFVLFFSAGKLYSLHSNTLRVQMALWYIAASLILVAILIAILSVASLIFVFCFRHYNGPLACDYCKFRNLITFTQIFFCSFRFEF